MRHSDRSSWQISVSRWSMDHDCALWFRAAEAIDAPAGGLVPGPLIIDPAPVPSAVHGATRDAALGDELVEGWLHWWHTLVAADDQTPPTVGQQPFGPPDFPVLDGFPDLQRIVRNRWREAHRWHGDRKREGMTNTDLGSVREGRIVQEVERETKSHLPAFALRFVLLPVADDEIRPVSGTQYLVPESFFDDDSRWNPYLAGVLRRLIR